MTNNEYINNIIELYFNGESTIEQDKELFQYFSSDDIDPQFNEYKEIFCGICNLKNQKISIPDNLEDELNTIIDKKSKNKFYLFSLSAAIASVAAIIIIVFTLTSGYDTPKDSFTDPSLAYNEMNKALELLSDSMKKGINDGKNTYYKIENKTNRIINKSIILK